MLPDFVRNLTHAHGQDESSARSAHVLDSRRLNDEPVEWNAHVLGLDADDNNDFTWQRLNFTTSNGIHVSQTDAHVCGKHPEDTGDCVRN